MERYETHGKDASRQWQDTPLYPGSSQARNPRGFKTPRCSPELHWATHTHQSHHSPTGTVAIDGLSVQLAAGSREPWRSAPTSRYKFVEITLIAVRTSAHFENRRPAVFLPDHRGTRALEHALSRALSAMPPLPTGAAPLIQFILLSLDSVACHLVSPQSAAVIVSCDWSVWCNRCNLLSLVISFEKEKQLSQDSMIL